MSRLQNLKAWLEENKRDITAGVVSAVVSLLVIAVVLAGVLCASGSLIVMAVKG